MNRGRGSQQNSVPVPNPNSVPVTNPNSVPVPNPNLVAVANPHHGVVIATPDPKWHYKQIDCLVFSRIVCQNRTEVARILIIPKSLIYQLIAKARKEEQSKSYIIKLKQGVAIWDDIQFNANGHIITSYERAGKTHKSRYDFGISQEEEDSEEQLQVAKVNVQVAKVNFITVCVISDERPNRRVSCPFFPNSIPAEQPLLNYCIPNVAYMCQVTLTIDFRRYNDNRPLAEWDPNDPQNHAFKLSRIVGVYQPANYVMLWGYPHSSSQLPEPANIVQEAPWNTWNTQPFPKPNPLYPKFILPYDQELFCSQCIILNEKEAYCDNRPNSKCLIGHIIEEDFLLIPGRTIGCDIFYSGHNNSYIIHRSHTDFTQKGPTTCIGGGGTSHSEEWPASMKLSVENPMKTRWCDDHIEFLGYVKLNRVNHFFRTFSIGLVVDPKNLMHGHFLLGDQNFYHTDLDVDNKDAEHGYGHPVWLRHLPDKRLLKWEIVELANQEKKKGNGVRAKHMPFTSVGLKLNRRGAVYCPHVCNFPMVLDKNTSQDEKLHVGDWFSFGACFNKEKQQYEVQEIRQVEAKQKYEKMQVDGEDDVWAFHIPLSQNYHATRHLLYNHDIGFVEDVDTKVTMFICAWEESHPNDPSVMVWCRENPDYANRLTPLCVIDI